MPWENNKQADALDTLASNIDIPVEVIDVRVIENTLQGTRQDLNHDDPMDEQDWPASIIQNMTRSSLLFLMTNYIFKTAVEF